jgi:hypothetical protein
MTDNHLKEIHAGLQQLFLLEGIRQVICVDDQYYKFNNEIRGDIIALIESFDIDTRRLIAEKIIEFKDLIWEDDAQWRDQVEKIWINADEKKQKDLYTLIDKLSPVPQESPGTDEEYAGLLKKIISPAAGVELKELSYSQWKEYYASSLKKFDDEATKNGTLFLFDQDLSMEEGGTPDQGIKIIKGLLDKHKESTIMCGLLSHTFDPDEEFGKWEKFAEENFIDRDRFILISKKRLREDNVSFVRRLRLPIISKYCKKLKEQTSSIIEKAFEESKKKIEELSVYDFEDIVFRSSYDEGIWEPDTLFRLYNIYQKYSTNQQILSNSDLFQSTDTLRKISKIQIGNIEGNIGELWKIQRLEYYEKGDQINGLHIPIGLGDIFQDSRSPKQKRFILLAQPCNLMVRTDPKGERTNDFHEAILAEIVENPRKPQFTESYYELLYFDDHDGTSRYIDFRKTYTVLLCILDLCVYNKDGEAKISSTNVCPPGVIPAWNYRFDKLKKEFDLIIKEYIEKKNKGYDENFLKKHLLPRSSRSGRNIFKPELKFNGQKDQGSITYNCRRIGRLCKQRAEVALSKYAHFISRRAFEHDFEESREKRIKARANPVDSPIYQS